MRNNEQKFARKLDTVYKLVKEGKEEEAYYQGMLRGYEELGYHSLLKPTGRHAIWRNEEENA